MFATSCNNGSIVVSVLHIHPVLWLNSRLLSKEIPQTQSSTRTASKRSFHFNKTLKAKQLFQKRGMAKRGCQTFFSAFDLGVWGAHLCQTCSTQLPSTSQWEETVLNQYSSMLFYALATTHELLMTSLPAVAQAWFGPSSTNRIKPTSWQCPTHRRFFFISPAAAFEARAASKICRHLCWITWWTSCRSIQILYKWCHCHADHAGQFPFLGLMANAISVALGYEAFGLTCLLWILR